MSEIWSFLSQNPAFVALVTSAGAIWIASIAVVVRSAKFRKKWLWGFLTTGALFFGWGVAAPGVTLSVGVPLGALYVLWFWRYGPSPKSGTPGLTSS